MARARARVFDFLVYVAFRFAGCLAQILPPRLAVRLVEFLADLAYRLDRRHRDIALDNLRHAFPHEYTEKQRQKIVRRVYRHFALMLLEMALFTRKVHAHHLPRYFEPEQMALFRGVRPVIVLTAHFGNWELSAYLNGLMGVRSHLVARPLDNPYIDRRVRAVREWTGHTVLSKNGDVRRMRRLLDDGGSLCTLGDQDAGAHGLFVPFFGRPASTHKAIAHLARKTGALIAVAGLEKTGGLLEYTCRVMDVVNPADFAEHPDPDYAITARCAAGIEAMIRAAPHQYLWLHRRWKHQPTQDEVGKAA